MKNIPVDAQNVADLLVDCFAFGWKENSGPSGAPATRHIVIPAKAGTQYAAAFVVSP